MSSFNFASLNTESKKTVRDGIDSKDWSFEPLKNFTGKDIIVNGFFFTDGKYGKQVVVIAEGVKINIPKRFTEKFEEIRDNDEARKSVLEGHLKLTNIREINSQNGKTVTFDFETV